MPSSEALRLSHHRFTARIGIWSPALQPPSPILTICPARGKFRVSWSSYPLAKQSTGILARSPPPPQADTKLLSDLDQRVVRN